MDPLISVIVPIYNVEQYLDKCVQSLLEQDYKNLEIVLVDDGSPDNCPQMIDEYAKKHEKIVAYHKKNGGLGDARNYGVQRARGDLIAFVDSDDYVEKTYLKDLYNLQKKFNSDISVTKIEREKENGLRKTIRKSFEDFCVDSEQAIFEIYSGQKVGWEAYGKLFRKKFLKQVPFPSGFYEDCACMYKILDECKKVAIGDYSKNYHYIQRQGSILKSSLDKRHLHIFDICREFENYISIKHKNLEILSIIMYRRAVTQLLNLQEMSWKTYKKIFYRYRPYFRKNLLKILKSRKVDIKSKIFMLMLCSEPCVFKMQRMILTKTNQR